MKLNTALAALAMSVVASAAAAQGWGHGPLAGPLTEAERDEIAAERFAAADADGDGQLTQDEVLAAAEEVERARRQERAARMIEALDTDDNGMLSLEEARVSRADRERFMDRSRMHRFRGREHR